MKPEMIDDEIGRHIAAAERSGELRAAPGYGQPMRDDPGWDETPGEFRLPFKILKNAGAAPPEIALFHERAALRAQLEAAVGEAERAQLQQALSDLEQRIALRLEGLRARGTL